MDYSRYTDEELRRAHAGATFGEPLQAECVKRFLAQDPRGDYQEGYRAGHDSGYDEGYDEGYSSGEDSE